MSYLNVGGGAILNWVGRDRAPVHPLVKGDCLASLKGLPAPFRGQGKLPHEIEHFLTKLLAPHLAKLIRTLKVRHALAQVADLVLPGRPLPIEPLEGHARDSNYRAHEPEP